MLPQILVRDLIAYVVSWLIIRRTQSLSGNVCPQVLFIGIPVPFRELMYAFGDYVEAYDGMDNSASVHSAPCIALHPVGNSRVMEFVENRHKK
jgi:hypothetical protein